MERHADHELTELKHELVRMATLAEMVIQQAVAALLAREVGIADDVVRSDQRIDRAEVAIDERCLGLLARFQPHAGDLRRVAMALKITNDLERIGDQAVNIAQRALALFTEPSLAPPEKLPVMADLVQGMLRRSIDAFAREDAQTARAVCAQDDQVDALDDAIVRHLLEGMTRDRRTISRGVQLVLISRHLERVADHATNIAEDVIYLVEGQHIKHHLNGSAAGPA
jgi:phosphate transport system protein